MAINHEFNSIKEVIDKHQISLGDFFKEFVEIKALKYFLKYFQSNFRVCDPLDREFEGSTEFKEGDKVLYNGLIKVQDLKDKLLNL